MEILGLETAVWQIANAWRNAKEANDPNPFVFVVGAGISCPSVPLASGIVEYCQKLVEERDGARRIPISFPDSKSKLKIYSHWLERAYDQPGDRQKYINKLIYGKPIPAANLRMAHLLISGLANIVITPNFDDFLARGLRLFGQNDFRICDRSETVDRISLEEPNIQIIHVHGTYQFYDIANLTGEIKDVAQRPGRTAFSMANLIDEIFKRRSPIIIGYSGWKGDVIMSAMKRCIRNKKLKHKLYWFCYNESDVEEINDWRKNHENIVVVSPLAPRRESGKEQVDQPGEASAHLPALAVLDCFVRSLEFTVPLLARDPFVFLANEIQKALGSTQDVLTSEPYEIEDPYSFQSVIRRVQRAGKIDREWQETQAKLEHVRNAVGSAHYEEAKRSAQQVTLDELRELKEPEVRGLLRLFSLATQNTVENEEDRQLLGKINARLDEFNNDATGYFA